MTVEPAIFTCSICGERSTDICSYCTKDACANHRCTRCGRCSDCCECDVPLSAAEPVPEPPAPHTHVEPPLASALPANESPEPEATSPEPPSPEPEPYDPL